MAKPTKEIIFSQSGGLFPSATLKVDGKPTHKLYFPRGTKFGDALKKQCVRRLKKGEGRIPKRKPRARKVEPGQEMSEPKGRKRGSKGRGAKHAKRGFPYIFIGGTKHKLKASTPLIAKLVHQLLCATGLKAHCDQELPPATPEDHAELSSLGYRRPRRSMGPAGESESEWTPEPAPAPPAPRYASVGAPLPGRLPMREMVNAGRRRRYPVEEEMENPAGAARLRRLDAMIHGPSEEEVGRLHRLGSAMGSRYTAAQLKRMPTISQAQIDDLKIDDGQTRVWLSRSEPGEEEFRQVTIENYNHAQGRWLIADKYIG
jgi:hypothetical protein